MVDIGHGSPLVLIPGIQGRREWAQPAVDALVKKHRVLSFSLTEGSADDLWTAYLDEMLDRAGLAAATFVGVSYGGIVAAHYASRRPDRVNGLVIVSSPVPGWTPERRHSMYLRHPVLCAPLFIVRALRNLVPEIVTSQPSWPARLRFFAEYVARVTRYSASPTSMARWVTAWRQRADDIRCDRITTPTLVITGEPHLDRVVSTSSTLEYLHLIPGARHVLLPRTGHVGLVTMPAAFAAVVGEFIDTLHDAHAVGTGRNTRSLVG
jgi:pimeloyl-ACP methyl ester carboxylesterase